MTRKTIRAQRCRAIAHEVLHRHGKVDVLATFKRCMYLACPDGIVCVGSGIGSGPINLELPLQSRIDWPAMGITAGIQGDVEDGRATVGSLSVEARDTPVWEPAALPAFQSEPVRRGLEHLRAAAMSRLPREGLAPLVFQGNAPLPTDMTSRAASGPLTAFRNALPAAIRADAWNDEALRSATLLVGLGPGLTPSGDDLLGGIMLALSTAGLGTLRDALWLALEPGLDDLTSPISAMHLLAAARGMAIAPVHNLLGAIAEGNETDMLTSLDGIASVGHCSGWDAASGLLIGLEACLAARSTG